MTVVIPGEPRNQAAMDVVTALRDQHIPSAFTGVPATALVGGVTADATDVLNVINRYTPVVFAFVLGFRLHCVAVGLPLDSHSDQGRCYEPSLRGYCLWTDGVGISKGR